MSLITRVLDCTKEHKKIEAIDPKSAEFKKRVRTGKSSKQRK